MDRFYSLSHASIDFRFKQTPRDFVVEEIPLYEFSGEGEHMILFVRKKSLSTNVIVGRTAGSKTKGGYIAIQIDRKIHRAHRLSFLFMEGYFPENDVDHINRVKHDNRWCNLRHVSHQCNLRNANIYKTNTSGVTGVLFYKQTNKWGSSISVHGLRKHLGYFTNIQDATKARWEGEKKYNFPNCNTTSTAYNYLKDRGLAT